MLYLKDYKLRKEVRKLFLSIYLVKAKNSFCFGHLIKFLSRFEDMLALNISFYEICFNCMQNDNEDSPDDEVPVYRRPLSGCNETVD